MAGSAVVVVVAGIGTIMVTELDFVRAFSKVGGAWTASLPRYGCVI